MRKTFPLEDPRRAPARVIESIKNDVRKYLKRERRKTLPEGGDYWDFTCRLGPDSDQADAVHVEELIGGIDRASREGWTAIYIEILATPGIRKRKEKPGDTGPAEQT